MKMLLSARKISKHYGAIQVLNKIDVDVFENEIVSIVGPSGAGKTTLLHLLSTLDRPNVDPDSSLFFKSTNLFDLKDTQLSKFRNQNMGFIFQFHELLPEFTALENVCIPGWLAPKHANNIIENKAMDLLKRLGLEDRLNHKPLAMSGGEQQRVAVARALINDPKIIFADEPSGNLDTENAKQLHDLFFELQKQRGCSFVIVTHNQELAKRSNRIVRLKDGKIDS
jgi:lipoprotein-releasing system ATP-binding protein